MVQDGIRLSIIIPTRDENDPKLHELLRSIDRQDFPKEQFEVLIITEGTSESAKAIGIRQSKGDIICILASDNQLMDKYTLSEGYELASHYGASYPNKYHYDRHDDILNRYFALIGGNDPLSYYMGKNDRISYLEHDTGDCKNKTIGDNGFFIRKNLIEHTDLDNYYHIDNAVEALDGKLREIRTFHGTIWHKTGGNIFSFFAKRYRYGLQHAFNKNRRWHLVDFHKPKDIWRLIWFILITLTLIGPLSKSFKGYRMIKDVAWFIHPLACIFIVVTYSLLMTRLALRSMFPSSSVPMTAQGA